MGTITDTARNVADATGLSSLFSGIASVRAELNKKTSEIETLKRKREDLAATPAALADIQDAIDAWVDNQVEIGRKHLHSPLNVVVRQSDPTHEILHGRPHIRSMLDFVGEQQSRGVATAVSILLMGPDNVRETLYAESERVVESIGTPGPPMKERAKQLAALDAKIESRQSELMKLRDDLSSAGVEIR
jgi:hypothetical protein